eukprot:TRINITY_DN4980_c4_g1_i1.p1 TRINITY_DN4980_c4_g1~~TRINITY_DN4980_c4_g1_i1.p1  ORF type:complete len:625 (+),score=115.94 TRINITY_DN4980_c4_g1_i1:69-1877(+)
MRVPSSVVALLLAETCTCTESQADSRSGAASTAAQRISELRAVLELQRRVSLAERRVRPSPAAAPPLGEKSVIEATEAAAAAQAVAAARAALSPQGSAAGELQAAARRAAELAAQLRTPRGTAQSASPQSADGAERQVAAELSRRLGQRGQAATREAAEIRSGLQFARRRLRVLASEQVRADAVARSLREELGAMDAELKHHRAAMRAIHAHRTLAPAPPFIPIPDAGEPVPSVQLPGGLDLGQVEAQVANGVHSRAARRASIAAQQAEGLLGGPPAVPAAACGSASAQWVVPCGAAGAAARWATRVTHWWYQRQLQQQAPCFRVLGGFTRLLYGDAAEEAAAAAADGVPSARVDVSPRAAAAARGAVPVGTATTSAAVAALLLPHALLAWLRSGALPGADWLLLVEAGLLLLRPPAPVRRMIHFSGALVCGLPRADWEAVAERWRAAVDAAAGSPARTSEKGYVASTAEALRDAALRGGAVERPLQGSIVGLPTDWDGFGADSPEWHADSTMPPYWMATPLAAGGGAAEQRGPSGGTAGAQVPLTAAGRLLIAMVEEYSTASERGERPPAPLAGCGGGCAPISASERRSVLRRFGLHVSRM